MDVDDYAKEECHCGHRRYAHGNAGGCSRKVMTTDWSGLPEPKFDNTDDPFEYPNNWPKPEKLPQSEKTCGCAGFSYPDSPEPTWA